MAYAGKFKAVVIRLQRAFRARCAHQLTKNLLVKRKTAAQKVALFYKHKIEVRKNKEFLVKRQEARLKIQKALKRAMRWENLLKEVNKRVQQKKDRAKNTIHELEEQASEIEQLREANRRMAAMLQEKTAEIEELKKNQKSAMGEAFMKKVLNKVREENTQLRQEIVLLQGQVSGLAENAEHGYF